MKYLSIKEIAGKWGVSERSVRNYCAQGRVPGAFLTGKTWNVPEDAVKPARGNAKRSSGGSLQRFALLERLQEEKAARVKGGIYHKVQVELTYNSNRIEGSRLSLEQTRLIFETSTVGFEGEAVRVDDVLETANHFRAVDLIIERALEPLGESMIKELHGVLKASTSDADRDWFAVGDYKRLPNEVAGRKTTAPEQVQHELRGLLEEYAAAKSPGCRSFEEILQFHVGFERIHPFQDGNGRVGRLIMFKECLANGIVPFVISDDMRAYYYRGLAEWDSERGYLTDTCLAAQDRFKVTLDYFRIPYDEGGR